MRRNLYAFCLSRCCGLFRTGHSPPHRHTQIQRAPCIAGEKCVVFRDCVNALAGSNGNINTSGIAENNVSGTYRPNDCRATETESPTRYVYDNGIRGAEGIDRPGFFIGDFIGKTLS